MLALLYQIKVKILGEAAGIAAVYPENKQLILRYRQQLEEEPFELKAIGSDVRVGKTALRMLTDPDTDWQTRLLEVLQELVRLSSLQAA